MNMREKVKDFITDYYKIGMTVFNLLLLASMPFNPQPQLNHFFYFTLISRILFPFVILFFGNKGLWVMFFLISNVNALDITFNDFTALSAICILYLFIPDNMKWLKVITASSYIIDIFVVAGLHDKLPYHLFVHFIGCGMLILTVNKLKQKFNLNEIKEIEKGVVKLNLTTDEEYIIQKLLEGYQQKEIDRFSPNTVSDKLKQARKRNDIEHTDELLQIYKNYM